MRYRVFAAAAVLTVSLSSVSQAADVSEQGAKDLRAVLTRFLSHDLAKSDFITVKPTSNRYEITYDLAKFLDKISSSDFSVAGLQPLMMYAEPMAKGLWNIDGDNSFNVSAHYKVGTEPATDINYSLASLVYSGIFDPSISYLRSMDVTAKDFKLSSVAGEQKIDAGASGLTYKLTTTDTAKPGTVDIAATGTMPGLYQKVSGPAAPAMDLHIDSLDFTEKASGVPVNELRDLLRFVFEHIKAKKLSKKGSDRFEQLVRAALPLFDALDETVTVNNLSVMTDKGNVALNKLTYSLKMNGLTKASSIGFGFRAENLKLDSGVIPAGYEALVPDVAVVEAGIPDMDFAAAADILLNTDFSASKEFSADEGKRLEHAVFPSGKLTIAFPEISATSGVYDVNVSGEMVSDLQQPNRYELKASILARDYDKSIAFVQNAAKTDPELNQVSFVMMMAKGFAKTDPDGRQRWDVAMAEDGTFTVNGQMMKAPK